MSTARMKKSDWSCHDVSWVVPKRKTPIAWSTVADADSIRLLSEEEELTFQQLLDSDYLIGEDARRVLERYVSFGYGDCTITEMDRRVREDSKT